MKTTFLPAMLAVVVLISACGKDDEPALVNQIQHDGVTYNVQDGLILDFGVVGSHRPNDFIITNGEISVVNQNDTIFIGLSASTYTLDIILWSPNTTSFVTGNYEFFGGINTTGKFYFDDGLFATDLNADGDSDDAGELLLIVTGGSINVQGPLENLTLDYNLTLEDGKSLKGNYQGPWEQIQSSAYIIDQPGRQGIRLAD